MIYLTMTRVLHNIEAESPEAALRRLTDALDAAGFYVYHDGAEDGDVFESETDVPDDRFAAVGLRAACETCGLDIEWNGYKWWDRGGNTTCGPSGRYDRDGHQIPIPEGTTHTPYRD